MPFLSPSWKGGWKTILAALLLLASAAWLYPTSSAASWSDAQWTRSLAGTTWTFSRRDGSLISKTLRLAPLGAIRGYANPNEVRWRVVDLNLEFQNQGGVATSRFPLDSTPPGSSLRLAQGDNGQHLLAQTRDKRHVVQVLALLSAVCGLLCLAAARYGLPQHRLLSFFRFDRIDGTAVGRHLAMTIICIWLLLTCAMAAMPAYVPDEAWFLYEALLSGKRILAGESWAANFVFHQNAFGYGGIWWSAYTTLALASHHILDIYAVPGADAMLALMPSDGKIVLTDVAPIALLAPMVLMRFVVLASVAAFGIALVRQARSGSAAVLSVLVLVSMPLAWWSGKLASPELLGAALFALGVHRWFISGQALRALVLASGAVAIKGTIVPIFLVLVVFVAWGLWRRPGFTYRRLLVYALACIVTFVLCNGWLLHDPKTGIEHLLSLSRAYHPADELRAQSDLILFLSPETWEGSNYGFLAYWSGGLLFVGFALLVAVWTQARLGLFLLCGGLLQYLFMLTQPAHSWYWFPALLPLAIPFSLLAPRQAAVTGMIVLASLVPFAALRNELAYKKMHMNELNALAIERSCIHDKLRGYQPDTVFDMAALGTFSANLPGAGWKAFNFFDSFITFVYGQHQSVNGKAVLVLGERSRRNFDVLRTMADAPDAVIGECGSIKLVKVAK